MKHQDKKKAEVEVFSLQKPLDWVIPDTVQAVYSNWVAVQQDKDQFTVSFFEIRKPILLGTPEQNKAKLESMPTIPAVCTARVVISREQFPLLIATMQQAYETYKPHFPVMEEPKKD